ncbi:MAG: hypothetical protein ACLQQ4_12705 [Bacteroidia bacterium]
MTKPEINFLPIKAYLPVGMPDIDALVEGTGLNPDRVRAIYHQFYMKRLADASNDNVVKTDKFKGGWVSLNSELLKKVATNQYCRYMDFLENKGLILVRYTRTGSKSYSKNGSSIQYKIPIDLLRSVYGVRHFRKEKITGHATLKAIDELKQSFRFTPNDNHLPLSPIYEIMREMLKMVRFDIDKAEDFLNRVAKKLITVRPTKSGTERSYSEMLILMDAVNEGSIERCVVDKFGERFHTQISNLWKELRPFMYFTDEPNRPLVALDLANSQPYFYSIAIDSALVDKVLPEFSPCIPYLDRIKNNADYKLFAELCATGCLYEYWMQLRGFDRDAAKNEIFRVMFSRNLRQGVEKRPHVLAFKKEFPSVYGCFFAIKNLTKRHLPFIETLFLKDTGVYEGQKASYKVISTMAQRMESRIIIHRIAPKLIEQGITPFITVHDSFIIKKGFEMRAKQLMEDEFRALGVIPPKIKTEFLKPR